VTGRIAVSFMTWLRFLILIVVGVPLALLLLPRSQVSVIHSFGAKAGPISEWSPFLFAHSTAGPAGNRFALNSFGKVTELRLRKAGIVGLSDLPGIEALTSLKILDLGDNPLTEPLDVSPFKNLEELHFRHTKLHVLKGLGNLEYLRVLDLRDCGLRSIDQLPNASFAKILKTIDLSENPLEGSFDALGFGSSVETVILQNTKLTHVGGLDYLSRLSSISVAGSPISEQFDTATAREVDISETRISDIGRLGTNRYIRSLKLEGMDLSKIRGLEQLVSLEGLSLKRCKEVDLSRLVRLVNLQSLLLHETEISDLRQLSALKRLVWLSLAGATVHSIEGLEGLPALKILDVRGMQSDDLSTQTVDRLPVLLFTSEGYTGVHDSGGLFLLLAAAVARKLGGWIFGFLVLITIALFLPIPKTRLTHGVLIARRILRGMTIGAVYALLLNFWFEQSLSDVQRSLRIWVPIVVVSSLFLKPLLTLLLETSPVSNSRLSISIRGFIRFLPFALLVGPYMHLWINMSRRSSPTTLGVIILSLVLLVFGGLAILLVSSPLVLSLLWERRLKKLTRVLQGKEPDVRAVLVVLLAQKVRNVVWSPLHEWTNRNAEETSPYAKIGGLSPISVFGASMLRRCSVTSGSTKSLRGCVIHVSRKAALEAKKFEFAELEDWVLKVFCEGWTPIWVVGDWVGEMTTDTPAMSERLRLLDSIAPFVSGIEYQGAGGVNPIREPPAPIADSLAINQLVEFPELESLGLKRLLDTAFTPVAVLIRGVFGCSSMPDRLDLLIRAVEVAVAFFSLVIIAEVEDVDGDSETTHADRKEFLRRKAGSLSRPDFGQWELLFTYLREKTSVPLAERLRKDAAGAACAAGEELRRLLISVGGAEKALNDIPIGGLSRASTITLLRMLRNKTTAHGPLTSEPAPEIYLSCLPLVIDFLNSLPWGLVTLWGTADDSNHIAYRGVHPCWTSGLPQPQVGRRVAAIFEADGGRGNHSVDASDYFRIDTRGGLAMCWGEETMLDPISGSHVVR